MQFFRQPFLHFLVIGVALFLLNSYRQSLARYQVEAVDHETRLRLADDFIRQSGRLPTAEQVSQLEAQELVDRMLFAEALRREYYRDDPIVLQRLLKDAEFLSLAGSDSEKIRSAIALGLHTSDEVVRRRMIQRMEDEGKMSFPIGQATEIELERIYAQEVDRWMIPARFNFRHVFFSGDQEDAEKRAIEVFSSMTRDTEISHLGDLFLQGQEFKAKSLHDIALVFGEEFSHALADLPVGQWRAPISSAYGVHLVLIEEKIAETSVPFEQVRPRLLQMWREAREQESLQRFIQGLRERYDVIAVGGQP